MLVFPMGIDAGSPGGYYPHVPFVVAGAIYNKPHGRETDKMHAYQTRQDQLKQQPATGYQHNLDEVQGRVAPEEWQRFRFIQGDIRDLAACRA